MINKHNSINKLIHNKVSHNFKIIKYCHQKIFSIHKNYHQIKSIIHKKKNLHPNIYNKRKNCSILIFHHHQINNNHNKSNNNNNSNNNKNNNKRKIPIFLKLTINKAMTIKIKITTHFHKSNKRHNKPMKIFRLLTKIPKSCIFLIKLLLRRNNLRKKTEINLCFHSFAMINF